MVSWMSPKGDHVTSPAPLSDEELARSFVAGDPRAFEQVVDRHAPRVRAVAYRITGSVAESEDLAQEVFLRVYRHRESYRADRPFKAWLDRICVNVCLTHQKRMQLAGGLARPAAYDETIAAHGAPGAAAPLSPEAHASHRDSERTVEKVLKALAEPFRTTLVLRVFGGLTYQEIADSLGCSLGTVMSRVSRARNQIRDRLKGRLGERA
jgi:RNA polymerase sigma-70 factor (ECF subfamily)